MNTEHKLFSMAFDETTSSGEGGGDKVAARANKELHDWAAAPIKSGIDKLREEDPVLSYLLMFLYTDSAYKEWGCDVGEIERKLRVQHWSRNLKKNLRQGTLDKIPDLIKLTLFYTRAFQTSVEDDKQVIATALGVAENWYKTDRPSTWNKWFEDIRNDITRLETQANNFMAPYYKECLEKLHKDERDAESVRDIKKKLIA